MTLEELARLMGHGFHPDNDPETYTTYPPDVTPDVIRAVLERAWSDHHWGHARDVYARVLDTIVHEKLEVIVPSGDGSEFRPTYDQNMEYLLETTESFDFHYSRQGGRNKDEQIVTFHQGPLETIEQRAREELGLTTRWL